MLCVPMYPGRFLTQNVALVLPRSRNADWDYIRRKLETKWRRRNVRRASRSNGTDYHMSNG